MTSQKQYTCPNNTHYELFVGDGRAAIIVKDLDSGQLVGAFGGSEEVIRKKYDHTIHKLTAMSLMKEGVIQ